MKLFILHYAGGSSHFYHSWLNKLDGRIDTILIDLPGHGRRMHENLLEDYQEICCFVRQQIVKTLNYSEEYAIFGHSMGGLLSYSLAKQLLHEGYNRLNHLFISGCEAPNVKRFDGIETKYLTESQLIDRITAIGGMSQEILNSKELMDIFLPIIKSDFIALDTFKTEGPRQQLNSSITLLNGRGDKKITRERIQWEGYTNGTVEKLVFEGEHFYLNDESIRNNICNYINAKLLT